MPSPCWVPAGRAVPQGCMEVSSGIGMRRTGADCPPTWVGWETPLVTPRCPPVLCSAGCAGTGLCGVSAACREAACSCLGVHLHDGLITAVLRGQVSTRCDVFTGARRQPGHLLSPAQRGRGRNGGGDAGVRGRGELREGKSVWD